MIRPEQDPISLPPLIAGVRGRAWKVPPPAERGAWVDRWLIEAPWAHPAWHSYLLSLVSLKPIAGMGPPKMYLVDASHELVLFATDPEHPREPILTRTSMAAVLEPANFAAQFREDDDDAASRRVARAVQMICDGQLSPDTDFLSAWCVLFGNNMVRRALPTPGVPV